MFRSALRLRIMFCTVLGAAGISCMGAARQREALDEAIHSYHRGLRWGEYGHVRSFLRGSSKATTSGRVDALRDIRITDVRLHRVNLGPDDSALVTTTIDWYHLQGGRINHSTVREKWQQQGGSWTIVQQEWVSGLALPIARPSRGEGGRFP